MTDNDRIVLNQIAKNQIVIMSVLTNICTYKGWLETAATLSRHIGVTQSHLEYNERTK